MLKAAFKLLLLLVLVLLPMAMVVGSSYLLLASLQADPLVPGIGSARPENVGRIKALLKEHDPRRLAAGQEQQILISEADLSLLLNAALPHRNRQGLRVRLAAKRMDIDYSLALPDILSGRFINLTAQFRQAGSKLALGQLAFGNAVVPGWLFAPLIAAADSYLRSRSTEYREAMLSLKAVRAQPQLLGVVYTWHPELADRIQSSGRDFLLAPEDRQRISAYYTEIARQADILPRRRVSLSLLLRPLFELALQRSYSGSNAAEENRALLLALGVAVSGSSIELLVGKAGIASAQYAKPIELILRGRDDLAKHFTISAAISAAAGSGLANTIGVFKELDDSRGGSGFSFADLLADRAGVLFAEVAMGASAAALQKYMSATAQESGYMPAITNLPEGIMELEFSARFEDLDSAAYALVNSELERRLASCTIHQSELN